MSIKNFKISTGLDLNGLVLEQGTSNTLLWNGDVLATQQYVTDSISTAAFDPSQAAGYWLDWNAIAGQFDVSIPAGTYASPADIPSLTGYATETYVNSQGFITSSALTGYATETYVGSQGFITSSALSGYATESYVTTALNDYTPTTGLDTAIGGYGYLKSADLPTMYTDSDAVDAISAALISGGGIEYVANTGFQVDTNVIATKAYVDATAQGLDVKASVQVASSTNIDLSDLPYFNDIFLTIDGGAYASGQRVLLRGQTTSSENGIYEIGIANGQATLFRPDDAIVNSTLTKGSFVFVEGGSDAGKGFVANPGGNPLEGYYVTWTQFSKTGNYINAVGSNLSVNVAGVLNVDLSSKQDVLTAGNGVLIETVSGTDNTIHLDLDAIAGTGITVNGNQLEAAPAYITSVDASFAVTNGELSLSDTITIASVELTDSVANVTAASDVFGNGNTATYSMGSNQTVGTLPTAIEVADIFVTLKDASGNSRTSKLTAVFTGNEAPTWTEYGIITSGWTAATTVGFDSSKNIVVNVTGVSTYSAKGVFTTIK